MNQILVTQKLYVTPELRRKKKLFKLQFVLCIFLVCTLFSYYIYAEYDRDKSEEVSQEILLGLTQNKVQSNNTNKTNNVVDTTIKKTDNILVVALDDNEEDENIQTLESTTVQTPNVEPQVGTQNNEATAHQSATVNGQNYTVESILRIPRLGINYPVIKETSEELLKISINKYWGPAPNTVGNYCVVGHNYKSKKMFGRLSEAVNGDIIELEDMSGNVVKYAVYDRYTVEPTNTACTSQLTNGRREVTLITCTNYGKERLIVKAREIK